MEKMRVKIQNLRLRALCEKSLFLRSLEKGEVVEPGTDIYVKVPDEARTKMATLVSLGETEDHVLLMTKRFSRSTGSHFTPPSLPRMS